MEPLQDPYNDRVMKEMVPPPHQTLSEDKLYGSKSKPLF